MATYLQGVTDFIPDYQPFQPDYNFYANALQTKQTQYDSNWKQLNNLYGQLYGADLTHGQNIEKKDELLKQIDFNLKRVSGLDLSLEQNVNQAMQVFRPFYEDKHLMKDMAWTKNWTNEFNSANALTKSQDEKQRNQYWPTGIKGLELRRQMFRDATLEETLNIKNAKYTPYVRAQDEYKNLAKKLNISKTVDIPYSSVYNIRKKNGDVILPTLQQLFKSEYANRPDIQDMYRERAFVERMSYAYENAEKFGNSKEAEKEYIRSKMDWLKTNAFKENSEAQDNLETTQNLQGDLEKNVKNNNLNPYQSSYGNSLEDLLRVESTIADNTSKLNNQLNDDQSTATQQGYIDDGSNLDLDRMKVDAGYASIYAQQDILAAANNYADVNSSVTYKVNQVGLANLKHAYKQKEIELIADKKALQATTDDLVKKGYWSYGLDGKLIKDPQVNGFNLIQIKGNNDAGQTSEDNTSFEEMNRETLNRAILMKTSSSVEHIMKIVNEGVDRGKFRKAQLAVFINNIDPTNELARNVLIEKNKNTVNKDELVNAWKSIMENYNNNPEEFTLNNINNKGISNINKQMEIWSKDNKDDLALKYSNDKSIILLNQWDRMDKSIDQIKNENYNLIKNKLTKDIQEFSATVSKNNPNVDYSQDRINKAVDALMYYYTVKANGNQKDLDAMAPEIDNEIHNILGFDIGIKKDIPKERSWYNYVFPITGTADLIFGDDRDQKTGTASWTKDIFDMSYESLIRTANKKGSLKSYFVNTVNQSQLGDIDADKFSYASGTASMKVMPSVRMDPGNIAVRSMMDIINRTNWNRNITDYRITTKGNIKPSNLEDDPGISQKQALYFIEQLGNRINKGDIMPFNIESSSVSMENSNLGSMTINPPLELLEDILKGMTNESGEALKSEVVKAVQTDIAMNGITFIAPKETWSSNPLFSNQFLSPTEIVLNSKPIKFEDPAGSGFYNIEKSRGSGDYIINGEYNILNPDGSMITQGINKNIDSKSGKLIDENELTIFEGLKKIRTINFQTFRDIVNSGNEEAVQKAINNFSSMNNSFWDINN